MRDANLICDLSYFIDDFLQIIEYFDLEEKVKNISGRNIEYSKLLISAKNNILTAEEVEIVDKVCYVIQSALHAKEIEIIEARDGTTFALYSIFSVFWLSYEGDVIRYFRSGEDAKMFISNW
jgi:hypothetical protein